MALAILKVSFEKQKPKFLNYCKYKFYNKFIREQFLLKLNNNNFSEQVNSLEGFQETCVTVWNSIVPLNCEFVKTNQTPFMNKKFDQIKGEELISKRQILKSQIAYSKQRNAFVSLLRKTKRQDYSNLDVKNVVDYKKFWEIVNPFFLTNQILSKKYL